MCTKHLSIKKNFEWDVASLVTSVRTIMYYIVRGTVFNLNLDKVEKLLTDLADSQAGFFIFFLHF